MRVYIAIRLPFLFHTSTISSKSLSVSFSRDSMTIFIKLERLSSGGYEGDSLLISCLRNFVPLML